MTLLLSLVLICQIFLIRKLFDIKHLASPIYILIYFYLISAILGYTIYSLFPDFVFDGFTSREILLNSEERTFTLNYFLLSINALLMGSLALLSLRFFNTAFKSKNIRKKTRFNSILPTKGRELSYEITNDISNETHNTWQINTPSLNSNILTFLCTIPTILLVIGVGPEKIWFKEYYLEISYRFLISISYILIMPTCLALGFNLANKLTLFNRFICLVLLSTIFIVFFSMATRFLSVLPILITCGYWFNSKRKKSTSIFLAIFAGMLFSPLLYLPLFLRGQSQHGFLPYIQYLGEMNPDVLLMSPLGWLSNLIFSFPLTGEVIKQRILRDYPLDYLLISLNPLPGDFVGWYEINTKLGLDVYTPFNTIGEMYLYGDPIGFLLFFTLGVILTFITIVFQKNLANGRVVYAMILFILILFFSFSSLQYNLRSSTRILYLAFVLSCFFNTATIVPKKTQKN